MEILIWLNFFGAVKSLATDGGEVIPFYFSAQCKLPS